MTEYLLNSKTAEKLYDYVKSLPIIDYHNHLSVSDICNDKRFTDIYELWLKPDPYKHRAMRMCGVDEEYITGSKSGREKFIKWCECVPRLVGNPLYMWTKMELETVFGIEETPSTHNADSIYERCNEYLKNNTVTGKSLLAAFNVELACPCMSLTEQPEIFKGDKTFSPSLRGDDITQPTCEFINKLAEITKTKIANLKDFEAAIVKRLGLFISCGLVFSDHALDNGFKFFENDGKNEKRFLKILKQKDLSEIDKKRLSSYILEFLGEQYSKYGLVLQLHIGAERYTSSQLRQKAGAAGGFAAIGNSVDVDSLTVFLDTLDKKENGLPKTVLFTLNPSDNALISVLSGSYAKDGVSGLLTQGPAWWWCDHENGIKEMLEKNAVYGLLSNFVGMTTDSRSFLSFVRHDYFRRILCNFIGENLDKNSFGCSLEDVKDILYLMCYGNAKNIIGN